MNHKVSEQGLVVPFGYVTAKLGKREIVYQQGQLVPADWTITKVEGDGENDAARNTETAMRLMGLKGDSTPKSV